MQKSAYLVESFSSFVKDMYNLGDRKIGVIFLPPLGCLPSTIFGFHEKGCVTRINNDAQGLNKVVFMNMQNRCGFERKGDI